MKISNPFRAELSGVSNWINEGLDNITARISAVFGVEHNDDGTHGAVTAESVTVAPQASTDEDAGAFLFSNTNGEFGIWGVDRPADRSLYILANDTTASTRYRQIVLYVSGALGAGYSQLYLSTDGTTSFINMNADHVYLTNQPNQIVHTAGPLALQDGITAPAADGASAFIYVDTADGDLKVRFADGVTKTLATDT